MLAAFLGSELADLPWQKADTAEDWEKLALRKIAEAENVNSLGHRSLAYDQYGYAVECMIKSVIMSREGLNRWPDYDDKPEYYTHGLLALIKSAGLFDILRQERMTNLRLRRSWLIVKDWKPTRYDTVEPSEVVVRDFGLAIMSEPDGIVAWLRRHK